MSRVIVRQYSFAECGVLVILLCMAAFSVRNYCVVDEEFSVIRFRSLFGASCFHMAFAGAAAVIHRRRFDTRLRPMTEVLVCCGISAVAVSTAGVLDHDWDLERKYASVLASAAATYAVVIVALEWAEKA